MLRCFRGISVEAASGVAQQMRMHHFDPEGGVAHDRRKAAATAEESSLGFFHSLPPEMQQSLVEWARVSRKAARALAQVDMAEQLTYHKVRRQENLQKALDAMIARYTKAMGRFESYEAEGKALTTKAELAAALAAAGSKAAQERLLKEQIEMRVLGLGWSQFVTT